MISILTICARIGSFLHIPMVEFDSTRKAQHVSSIVHSRKPMLAMAVYVHFNGSLKNKKAGFGVLIRHNDGSIIEALASIHAIRFVSLYGFHMVNFFGIALDYCKRL